MHSNIDIKKSLTINQDLNLNNITFNITNSLPIYNTNTMVYTTDNLYFNHNNKWVKLINEDLKILNTEQLIYDSNIINLVNINTNVSIIEITQTLTSDIYIVLPLCNRNGIEKTIIMGQSINKYGNDFNIILYSKYIDVSGIGPVYMNLKFHSTGQLVKLISIVSNNDSIFGSGNKYWQIVIGHFDSNDLFSLTADTYSNTNDPSTIYQTNVTNNYEQTAISNDLINNSQTNLIDTLKITNYFNNTISLLTSTTIIEVAMTFKAFSISISLPTTFNYGQRKTILLGNSVPTTNTQNVEITSTFYGGLADKIF